MNEDYVSIQDHSKIINALQDTTLNHKAIALEVAKFFPSIFLRCMNVSNNIIDEKIIDVLNHPGKSDQVVKNGTYATPPKIEAIKLYKECTGCGLKEAKDYVEKMIPVWVKEGRIDKKYGTNLP